MADGRTLGVNINDADFTAVRAEIEDLIGLDACNGIEAETVERDHRAE
jgi:hypothetical protein